MALLQCCWHSSEQCFQPPAPGARSGIDALSLEDYADQFAQRAIITGWRGAARGPIHQQVLGPAFASLPPEVQALHQPGPRAVWSGRARVRRGTSRSANLVATLFNFPRAGADVPVTVAFRTDATGRETWARTFDGRLMRSTQEAGTGRNQHLITERFGPFAFGLALVIHGDRLRIIPRRWSIFGLPLPRFAMPHGDSHDSVQQGKFHFHVEIALPLIGPVVRYDGWLQPA